MQNNVELIKQKSLSFIEKNPTIEEIYLFSDKLYKLVNIVDANEVQNMSHLILEFYNHALETIEIESNNGCKIFSNPSKREIALIYRDESKDKFSKFFEIIEFAKSKTSDKFIQLLIIGFFMKEERMTIIQAYNCIYPLNL